MTGNSPTTAPGNQEPQRSFVVTSELRVTTNGVGDLERAFAERLGEVDHFEGFQRLEVWADERDHGRYLMISWWDQRETFLRYMRSDEHRRSHTRIPGGDNGPRPVSVQRYRLIAT
jgi:heme-degrading monooxygenase HmoA